VSIGVEAVQTRFN